MLVRIIMLVRLVFAMPFLLLCGVYHELIDWSGKYFDFSINWEDPAVDAAALKFTPDDHVLTLVSGGDIILDNLIDGVRVTGVDVNPCQIALAEMKLVAIQHLEYEDFFQIFAKNDLKLLKEKFPQLKPYLSEASVRVWEGWFPKMKTIIWTGKAANSLRILFNYGMVILGIGWWNEGYSKGLSQEEMRRRGSKHKIQLQTFYMAGEFIFRLMDIVSNVLGSNRAFNLGVHRTDSFERIISHVAFNTDPRTNYFYYAYLNGEWSRTNCPRYLKPERARSRSTISASRPSRPSR
jgi:hypothetical protein